MRQDNVGGLRRPVAIGAAVGFVLAVRGAWSRLNEADLTGQVALVTGGSRGFGLLVARELARQGCRVAICARDAGELEVARADLEKRGAQVFVYACDVSNRDQVQRMVEATAQRFGPIDILVNNAGIIQVGPLVNATLDDFEQAMDVMYWGVVYPTLAVLPQMRARGAGRIANVTSIGGKLSMPHLLPYGSAKFAATGFSEGLRAELAGEGITVTTIVPGLMRTGSYLQTETVGRHEDEYTWFALGSTLPLISMDAERAAFQIVQAIRRGEAERILSIPANLAARFHGLFPGTTTNILALVNRVLLPSPRAGDHSHRSGKEDQRRVESPLFNTVTGWGRSAARRFNQYANGG